MLERMKAVVITKPGDPDVLRIRDLPDPEPGPEEVVVRVRATALNRADLLQRRGLYPAPPGAPADVPGLEFAGEVVRCGELVRTLRPGARVMGILGGGGYAERVCIHERLCLPVPENLTWVEAAAIPEAFLTAFDALFRQARLHAGEALLLHAAASGVGTAAAQLALAEGATVIGLSRTETKRHRLAEFGLHRVLDPMLDGLADAIRAAAGGDGVDVVLDMVGAPAWPLNLEVVKPRGRIVVIGLLGGARIALDLGTLLFKRVTVIGSALRSRSLDEKIDLTSDFAGRMGQLLVDGRLRATVDRTLPIDRAAEAHAAMERNVNFGKLVLTVGEA
jgi:putative PIG3 family NAD(P)H quinone oxidoreductase